MRQTKAPSDPAPATGAGHRRSIEISRRAWRAGVVVAAAASLGAASEREACAQPAPRPPAQLDLNGLFAPPDGALSAGFPDRHRESTGAPIEQVRPAGGSFPFVELLFNPALAPLGKWAARVELMPFRYLSVFAEGSRADIKISGIAENITGYAIEIGLHLYPLGRGLRGAYLGPRLLRASGSIPAADGTVAGFGGDIGYQWVFGVVALNLGLGIEHATVTITPSASIQDQTQIPDDLKQPVDKSVWLPVATAGIGLAF